MFSELRLEDLQGVLEEVRSVSAKWYFLGLVLGIPSSRLDTIQHSFSGPRSCLREIIVMWLGSFISPTWGTLIHALKSRIIGEYWLAEELRKKYIPTSTEGNNHALRIMMVTALHMHVFRPIRLQR